MVSRTIRCTKNVSEIKQQIQELNAWAIYTDCYDIALFRIWLIFEKYLIEKFIQYSIGETGDVQSITYKIKFLDKEHLSYFLKGDRTFVEYLGKIEKLSKHIFENNPFTIIIDDATHSKIYNELKTIRNQVAHDSDESRTKFFKDCLFSRQSDKELGVNEYLKRDTNQKIGQSNYSRLIEGVIHIITFIDDPFFT